jgi:hypothetical protein
MYSKGISWIDDCRIPFVDGDKTVNHNTVPGSFVGSVGYSEKIYHENTTGRFPANLLVSDDMLNDGKKYGNLFNTNRNKDVDGGTGNSLVRAHKQGESNGVFDNGISSSRFYNIDKWFDNLIDV